MPLFWSEYCQLLNSGIKLVQSWTQLLPQAFSVCYIWFRLQGSKNIWLKGAGWGRNRCESPGCYTQGLHVVNEAAGVKRTQTLSHGNNRWHHYRARRKWSGKPQTTGIGSATPDDVSTSVMIPFITGMNNSNYWQCAKGIRKIQGLKEKVPFSWGLVICWWGTYTSVSELLSDGSSFKDDNRFEGVVLDSVLILSSPSLKPVLLSFCLLESPEKRKLQLRNCIHYIGQWACL